MFELYGACRGAFDGNAAVGFVGIQCAWDLGALRVMAPFVCHFVALGVSGQLAG